MKRKIVSFFVACCLFAANVAPALVSASTLTTNNEATKNYTKISSDETGSGILIQNYDASGIVPVYRLYLAMNGEHLYTTDAHEVDVLTTENSWEYEGIGWYAPSYGKAVYRLFSPGLANHLYTTDLNEIAVLTTQYDWVVDNDNQPLFYSGGSIGIYRLYNESLNGMHLLSTDTNEYNVIPAYGWEQEGTKLLCLATATSEEE